MIDVAVGIILRELNAGGTLSLLLCQRKRTSRYPWKWEFPGGKLEKGELVEDCLRRELNEELGISAHVGTLFHKQEYIYPDSGLFRVHYHLIPAYRGTPENKSFEAIRWVRLDELGAVDILEGNREVVGMLIQQYGDATSRPQ